MSFNSNNNKRLTNSNRQEQDNFQTLRRYAERLNQERQRSLSYLRKINELTEIIAEKDREITRLTNLSQNLNWKFELVQSMMTQSRHIRGSLKISQVIDDNKFTNSKIQHIIPDRVNLFQLFFVLDPHQLQNNKSKSIKYIFSFQRTAHLQKIQQGFRAYLHNIDMQTMFQNNNQSYALRSYLFLMNSPFTIDPNFNCPKLNDTNPSYYYFCMCLVEEEKIAVGTKIIKDHKIYGFVGLFPYIEYFLALLETICRSHIIHTANKNQLTRDLTELSNVKDFQHKQFQFLFLGKPVFWNIPRQLGLILYLQVKKFLSHFSYNLIIDVLILLLLQIPIIITTTNQQLLVNVMLYFVLIIKPLKYPFPIIFDLPLNSEIMLQSPFPSFFGCARQSKQQLIEEYMNEKAIFDLDEKKRKGWQTFNSEYADAQKYLMAQADRLIYQAQQSNQLVPLQKLENIVPIILNSRNVPQMQTFWANFEQTQIYNVYLKEHLSR